MTFEPTFFLWPKKVKKDKIDIVKTILSRRFFSLAVIGHFQTQGLAQSEHYVNHSIPTEK